MKMSRGGHRNISGIKGGGGALKVLDILMGGSKHFKVLVQQGPGVFTPTIVT
jgi:ribose 5-phosphate isomerase